MLGCGCVLLAGLLTLTSFSSSAESIHIPQERPENVESSINGERAVQQGTIEQKTSGAVRAKLLLHNHLVRLENDVIETKRKRSFPGFNTPLDRLSISSMDPKSNKQRNGQSSCVDNDESTGLPVSDQTCFISEQDLTSLLDKPHGATRHGLRL
ncbi:hypothetical protein DNTS_015612 [Danionella cerebrum]|uniref:Osteocrin n=1 Tax=Danionella cerebrum TaxID=2873325 RepID=A0A553QSB6_9TELE|nr:hypothetical protein DNTS_015612 [Danionella translucida]